jgi:hypothetical protein
MVVEGFGFLWGFLFWHRVSLCSPGWPKTLCTPTSASWGLGLKAFATMLAWFFCFR